MLFDLQASAYLTYTGGQFGPEFSERAWALYKTEPFNRSTVVMPLLGFRVDSNPRNVHQLSSWFFPGQLSFFRLRSMSVIVPAWIAFFILLQAQGQQSQSVLLSSSGRRIHIVAKNPHSADQRIREAGASAPFCVNGSGTAGTCSFNYYGGPIISNLDVVVVYWGSTVSNVVKCGGGTDSKGNCIGVSRFFSATADSTFVDMLQQYNTNINANAGSKSGSPGTGQSVGRGTVHVGSPFVITPHTANAGSPITDANIQNEIQAQITAGTLPAPATDSTGNVNTLYFVYFPPGLVISDPEFGSCVSYCAYHGTFALNSKDIPYGVIPDFGPGSGCDLGCGTGSQWQNVTSASSHEFAESITDEAVGIGNFVDYPLAWYDINNGEIGDPCNQSTDTFKSDSISFTVQQEFSQKAYAANHSAGCVSPGALTFTLTAPASGPAGAPFDVTVKVANTDGSTYLGTAHFTSGDSTATLPSDYTFTVADAGTHQFANGVTLGTNGSQTITATDANQASTAGTATVNVGGKTAITTTLTSSAQPSTYLQPITFTAIVTATSGSPTGQVTFKDGASTIGTGTLSGGVASITISTLTVGTHSITAAYGGDTNFSGGNSVALSQIVSRASTITALTSTPNPSIVNRQVTFTATVAGHNGGTPSGSITFKQGTTVLATKSLVNASATFATTYATSGSRSLTAAYSGDGNFLTSSSSHSQSVLKAPTTTFLTSSQNPSNFGGAVTFTATVGSTAGTPANGDTVHFIDGTTIIGSGSLSGGIASFTTTALTAGTHKIKAAFVTDSSYGASSSTVVNQVVIGLPTTSTVSSNLNPSTYGQTITFTAKVVDNANSGTPTGTVSVKAGTNVLAKVALSSGTASFSISTMAVGTKSITVTYNGDAKYAPSTSSMLSQIINKATSATTISSSMNPSTSGQSVTFTISVAPQFTGVPTGTVKLTLGTTVLATVTLVNGAGSFTTTALPVGSDLIKATCSGSGNFTASSVSITQTVN